MVSATLLFFGYIYCSMYVCGAAVGGWAAREGRPRNLGRGVSKPKKNTVASLLAQSRALGLRPALAHQLLAETDLVSPPRPADTRCWRSTLLISTTI